MAGRRKLCSLIREPSHTAPPSYFTSFSSLFVFSARQMLSSGFCSGPEPQTKDTEPAVCCNAPRASQSSCCDPVAPQASAVEVKTLQVICQRLKQLMDDADGESEVGEQSERSESSRRAAGGKNNSEEVRSTRVKIPSKRWTAACFPAIVSTLLHFPPSWPHWTDLLRFGVQTDRWSLWFLLISPFQTRWHRRDACRWTQTPARPPPAHQSCC